MGTIASQITSLTIVHPNVYSGADQRKHQSSASLAFVRRIHRWPVNSPYKWPVTRKMFPFDDVVMHTVRSRYIAVIFLHITHERHPHQIWPKFYYCNCCAACTIISYITAIYRESIIRNIFHGFTVTRNPHNLNNLSRKKFYNTLKHLSCVN